MLTSGGAVKPPWEAKKDEAKNGKGSGVPWEQGGKANSKSEDKGTLLYYH